MKLPRFLVTGDWQASWSNLDQCNELTQFIIDKAKELRVTNVIHLGDLKQHYSPVDVRVVNFGVSFVKRLKDAGLSVIILLGNHDRASLSANADNWFPALRAAGATAIEKPTVTGDGQIALVPYIADPSDCRRAFMKMAKYHSASVLLFHYEVRGCRANVQTKLTESALTIQDLKADQYKLCLGGHIHMYQKLPLNVYYVGSPFAHDWGEANQHKGIVLVEDYKVHFIETPFPRLYDESLPGFKETKPKSWNGAGVRIHVACDKAATTNYQAFIQKATAAAQAKYKGADITVVPEFLESGAGDTLKDDGTDLGVVKSYVAKTCPPSIKEKPAVVRYLASCISKYGSSTAAAGAVKLLKARGENFLSFKQVEFKYKPGITVITGRNKDWKGRNNGSGKTNFLQLPAVAVAGSTLKEQTADQWVFRNIAPRTKAFAELELELPNGKRCVIYRQRKPTKLQVTVNGKDYAVGNNHRGTQEAIDKLTGLSWEALQNAMYIDQGEVSTILKGTDTERKAIFSKLLNLERFSKARKDCADKVSAFRLKVSSAADDVEDTRREIIRTKELISDIQTISYKDAKQQRGIYACAARKAQALYVEARKKYYVVEEAGRAKIENLELRIRQADTKLGELRQIQVQQEEIIDSVEQAGNKGACPECQQVVPRSHIRKVVKKAKVVRDATEAEFRTLSEQVGKLALSVRDVKDDIKRAFEQVSTLKSEYQDAKEKYSEKNATYEEARRQREASRKYKATLVSLRVKREQLQRYLKVLQDEQDVEQYCVKALSKDGIPAYLSARICPLLNAAAKKYSTLFSEDEIQVRFQLEDEDIDVEIVNIHGGSRLEDQSQGETRIAGIITGFAIRDVINPCNVLILDEPSESLDAVNAKVFAEGLRVAAKSLGAILLTTHNPYVLGELQNERLVEVTKRNGISTLGSITQ